MKNKGKWIVSILLLLLPIVFGLLIWNRLPAELPIHFGADGAADGFASRFVAVVVLPLVLLALHFICVFSTRWDNKRVSQSPKVLSITFWICPVLSLFASAVTYSVALGHSFALISFIPVILGVLFVLMGNYMPKCKRNQTIGVKVRWALANDENWNYTHRLAGKCWVIGGFCLAGLVFVPAPYGLYVLFPIILLLALFPMLGSYLYYRKQLREGSATKDDFRFKNQKARNVATAITVVLCVVLMGVCLFFMFSGDLTFDCGEENLTVSASYYEDATVRYAEIESVAYYEDFDRGARTMGFGSPRLSMGAFKNEALGDYTCYAYTTCRAAVVVTVNGEKLALSGRDEAQTREIYEELLARMEVAK